MFASLSAALSSLQQADSIDTNTAALIENGDGACYVVDADGFGLLYLSPKAFGFLPQSFKERTQKSESWFDLICEEDRSRYQKAADEAGETRKETRLSYRIEISTHNIVPAKDSLSPLFDKNQMLVGYMGRLVDDTFRIRSLDTLSRRSWKEVATLITRRFLHDFNNMIAGIYSLSELYAAPGSTAEAMTEAMAHIRDSSARAQKTTRQIREIATLNEGEASYHDIGKLIEEQKDYLAALLPKGAALAYELSDESLPARLDANRFKQTLLHLAANAKDATGDRPEILIRCHSEASEETTSGFAVIQFSDNGSGIKPRHLDSLTEPFFTTKDPNTHAGMGLFIVDRFVQELGGNCSIDSDPGKGTTVTLKIPLANLSETFPTPSSSYNSELPSSTSKPKRAPTVLVYSWEDITRHPLINLFREYQWKYRIHIDREQLELDIRELEDQLDGVVLFKSELDDKIDALILRLADREPPPRLAVIALGESIDAFDESLKTKCALLASGVTKPATLIKQLTKSFS